MSHASLDGHTTRLASIDNIGGFSVTLRRQGLELPFHGLCQLDGGAAVEQRAITASQPPAR
jgi:hypothetical protein